MATSKDLNEPTGTASVENYTFPVLNDGQNESGIGGLVKLDASILETVSCFCAERNIDIQYYLAGSWLSVMCQFSGVDSVNMGIQDGKIETVKEVGSKKSMLVVSAPAGASSSCATTMLHPEAWISRGRGSNPTCYDTGICPDIPQFVKQPDLLTEIGNRCTACDDEFCRILLVTQICDGNPTLFVAYQKSVLSDEHARNVTDALGQAMISMSQNHHQLIRNIDIVGPAQHKLIDHWNHRELTKPATVYGLFQDTCVRYGEKQAIEASDGALTFIALQEYSSCLASHLSRLYVRPGAMVPLFFEKSMWFIVAMLAVNKTGAAFVPIDPSIPQARLDEILRQLGPRLALTSTVKADLLVGRVESVVIVSESLISKLALENNEHSICFQSRYQAHHPAYCTFTSGSTGVPKGCVAGHAALANLVKQTAMLRIDSETRALQFASFSFSIALPEIICTLLAGGTVCMPSTDDRLSNLAGAMRSLKVNWAIMTPTVLSALRPQDVPTLKTLAVGAEPLGEGQMKAWVDSCCLLQAYGMTEWSGGCTASRRIRSVDDRGVVGKSPTGRWWLVDPTDHTRLAPIGGVAELLVECPGISDGYLHSPEKTASTFIRAPGWRAKFSGYTPNTRLLKSGDLVRYTSDGSIRCLGRRDRRVKVRGQRVELGEVEYQLAQAVPNARRIVAEAVAPAGENGKQVLAAFIQLKEGVSCKTPDTVCEIPWLAARSEEFNTMVEKLELDLQSMVPSSMIPEIFVSVSTLPITTTSKVDHQELQGQMSKLRRAEISMLTGVSLKVTPPQTEKQRIIHHIVADLLQLPSEQFGTSHNFFSLGGDSVAAMKLLGLAQTSGVQLKIQDVLEGRSLAEVADKADLVVGECSYSTATPLQLLPSSASQEDTLHEVMGQLRLQRCQIEDIYPCTAIQERWMNYCSEVPGALMLQCKYELHPHVDLAIFKRAWQDVVEANSSFQTRIISTKSTGMVQVVVRDQFQWDVADDLRVYLYQTKHSQMQLGDILTRAALITENREDHSGSTTTFVLTLHHTITDRWSIQQLEGQLERAYQGETLNTRHFGQFMKYVNQQTEGAEDFWKSQLLGLRPCIFPELPSKTYLTVPDKSIKFGEVLLPKRSLPDITVSNHIRVAWAMAISHRTNSDDVLYGVVVSGRGASVAGIKDLKGPATAHVPLRMKTPREGSVLSALRNAQRQSLDMMPFEQTRLQNFRNCGPEAEKAYNFQCQMRIHPTWDEKEPLLFASCDVGPIRPRSLAIYALVLDVYLQKDRALVTADFDSNVLGEEEAIGLLQHFKYLVQEAMINPAQPIQQAIDASLKTAGCQASYC